MADDAYLVLDEKFAVSAVVEGYESLIWTERFLATGDFEIETVATPAAMVMYPIDSYIWSSVSNTLMIIEDVDTETSEEDSDKLKVTGRCLKSILDRRLAWASVSLNGNLQTELRRIINENAIAPGEAARRIPELAFAMSTDPAITGLSLQANYLGKNLLEVVEDICSAYGIGYEMTFSEQNKFVFKLVAGVDRSTRQTKVASVTLSPNLDNLSGSRYFRSRRNMKNMTLIGGEGQGSDRRYTTYAPDTTLTGLKRREIFTDAGGLSSKQNDVVIGPTEYAAQLQQKGREVLQAHPEQVAFDGKIEKSQLSQFNVHFWMGDILTIENEFGVSGNSRVTEYIRSYSVTGREEYPTLTSI